MNERNCLKTLSSSLARFYMLTANDPWLVSAEKDQVEGAIAEGCDNYAKAFVSAKYNSNIIIFSSDADGNFFPGFKLTSFALQNVKHSICAPETAVNLSSYISRQFLVQRDESQTIIAGKVMWWKNIKDHRQVALQACLLAATAAFALYKYRCGTCTEYSTIVPLFLMGCAIFGLPKFVESRIEGLRDSLECHFSRKLELCAHIFYVNSLLAKAFKTDEQQRA